MDLNRRNILGASATALAAGASTVTSSAPASAASLMSSLGRDATHSGVRPGSPDDQTLVLQRAIDDAARARMPLALPPGVYRSRSLRLPDNAQLVGVRGATRLEFGGGQSLLQSEGAAHVSLTGLLLDGGLVGLPNRRGLVHCDNGRDVRVSDCEIINSRQNGIWFERVSGQVSNNIFRGIAATALVSFDAAGLLVSQNTIVGTRQNGIEIVRHQTGDDGTLVINNRIEDIVAGPGGSGQYGNAINAFRAANVIVSGNRIRNCDFSGIRGNSASNIQIVSNSVTDVREVALYSEFAFEGAIIAQNIVDTCAIGAVACNFNEGGRIAVVQGNILRNIFSRRREPGPDDRAGIGISVEADVSVTGNVIENAESFGIYAGWGKYLRDVAITGNVIRNTDVGIALSVSRETGQALVHSNVISNTRTGAVIGFDHAKRVSGELASEAARRSPHHSVVSNLVR